MQYSSDCLANMWRMIAVSTKTCSAGRFDQFVDVLKTVGLMTSCLTGTKPLAQTNQCWIIVKNSTGTFRLVHRFGKKIFFILVMRIYWEIWCLKRCYFTLGTTPWEMEQSVRSEPVRHPPFATGVIGVWWRWGAVSVDKELSVSCSSSPGRPRLVN